MFQNVNVTESTCSVVTNVLLISSRVSQSVYNGSSFKSPSNPCQIVKILQMSYDSPLQTSISCNSGVSFS